MFPTTQIKLPPNDPIWQSGPHEPKNQSEVRKLKQTVISLSERLSSLEYEMEKLHDDYFRENNE